MKENEIDRELEKVHIQYEKQTEWFAYTDLVGKLYAVPDTSRNFGIESDVPKMLKTRKLEPDDEIFAYNGKYIMDTIMQIRYGIKMKFSELPQDFFIYPGNAEDRENEKERLFKGVLI